MRDVEMIEIGMEVHQPDSRVHDEGLKPHGDTVELTQHCIEHKIYPRRTAYDVHDAAAYGERRGSA